MASQADYDLLVVGGGINGAGIARDAAGRGLRVLLVEQDDFARHTSSASTKLIHGGLRYLEYYEFRLVREALIERERLLAAAPHIIWPLRFVLPHRNDVRPAWMVRLGLFLYDHLGGRKRLPGSEGVRFRTSLLGSALKPGVERGFVYSDCWVQDSRLVVLNARDAAEKGAELHTRTRFLGAQREGGIWRAEIEDLRGGGRRPVTARILVNAAGPWVSELLTRRLKINDADKVRLVKGSHIVVPRMFAHDHAYIFQQPDRRIVFAIPYERDFTLIGTTDMEYKADPAHPRIDADEVDYLCAAANRYFRNSIAPGDVVWTYSGVRPLLEDEEDNASEVTRDYRLEVDANGPPLLSVFGGKLTTYRKLAEQAVDRLESQLGRKPQPWTADGAPLPGGDMLPFDQALALLRTARPWLPKDLAWRLVRNYGSRARRILGEATALADLGEHFGADLYQAEVDYLRHHEWVVDAEDLLWRRSKLGLRLTPAQQRRLAEVLRAPAAAMATRA